jgi:hypothetical protein
LSILKHYSRKTAIFYTPEVGILDYTASAA